MAASAALRASKWNERDAARAWHSSEVRSGRRTRGSSRRRLSISMRLVQHGREPIGSARAPRACRSCRRDDRDRLQRLRGGERTCVPEVAIQVAPLEHVGGTRVGEREPRDVEPAPAQRRTARHARCPV